MHNSVKYKFFYYRYYSHVESYGGLIVFVAVEMKIREFIAMVEWNFWTASAGNATPVVLIFRR